MTLHHIDQIPNGQYQNEHCLQIWVQFNLLNNQLKTFNDVPNSWEQLHLAVAYGRNIFMIRLVLQCVCWAINMAAFSRLYW